MVPLDLTWLRKIKCATYLVAPLFFCANQAFADIAPRGISVGVGPLAINTYASAYVPSSTSTVATFAGIDVAIGNRWSLGMNTIMSVDDSLIGYSMGAKLAFGSRSSEVTGGTEGFVQHTTLHVPRWHFDVYAGLARYRFNQTLTSTNTNIVTQLRKVPVKADLFGFMLIPSVIFAVDENWGIQGQYSYNYGLAGGFNLVAHGVLFGANYSF